MIKTAQNICLVILKQLRGSELLLALCMGLLIIFVGVSLGYENNKVVPANPAVTAHYNVEPTNKLSFMANWDGPIYLRIAHEGYADKHTAGFFPLYPLLISGVNSILGSPLYSALIVSWVAFVGAIYFYIKILKKLFGIKDNFEAMRGALLFILFPTAIFLIAVYTESLFALLALGAIYFALSKKYLPSALFAMFATATHVNGVFVLALIALLLYEQKEKLINILLALVIGSLGLVFFMAFLLVHYHNPLEFVSAQKTNGWLQQGYLHHLASTINFFNLIPIALIGLSVIYWWSRKRSFSIYSALYLCIPLIGGQFWGFNRYSLMAFPFQWMLYEKYRNSKLAYPMIIALFGIFWAYFLLQYVAGYNGG
jgi:Gpi18-like mannosyltransferase